MTVICVVDVPSVATRPVGAGMTYVNAFGLLPVPPMVVAVTICAPAFPIGVIAVIVVEFTTTTLVAATPPTVTLLAPVKFVPIIVIVVPPVAGPLDGLTLATVGAATYVNCVAAVTGPPAVVTTTFCAPAVPIGVVAVITVALLVNTVALTPPTVTLLALVKLVPVIVIVVPPAAEPELGAIVVIVGAAT